MADLLGYEGKPVVLVGAATGMGDAATKHLVELGAEVYALDIAPIEAPVKQGIEVDLRDRGARIIPRQAGAGSQILLEHLADRAGLALSDLDLAPEPARNETELAMAILENKADAGVAVAAVAHQLKLGFVPLARERYDLVMRRRDYFEPPFQKLLAAARAPGFSAHAADLGGYDITGLGHITYNGP